MLTIINGNGEVRARGCIDDAEAVAFALRYLRNRVRSEWSSVEPLKVNK